MDRGGVERSRIVARERSGRLEKYWRRTGERSGNDWRVIIEGSVSVGIAVWVPRESFLHIYSVRIAGREPQPLHYAPWHQHCFGDVRQVVLPSSNKGGVSFGIVVWVLREFFLHILSVRIAGRQT